MNALIHWFVTAPEWEVDAIALLIPAVYTIIAVIAVFRSPPYRCAHGFVDTDFCPDCCH